MQQSRGIPSASPGPRVSQAVIVIILTIVLVAALIGIDLLILSRNNPIVVVTPHYYMALGDSLSFGYQPNLDFSSGFADDIYNDLRGVGATEIVNYACAGESTATMIQGGCEAQFAHKGSYTGAQLQAALNFLANARNQGHVSPVTLEIGANDVFPDWNESTCSAGPNGNADLATMDANLTNTILPALQKALVTPHGARSGDLHLLNYYNPFAKVCPDSGKFIRLVNDHLAADAAKFRIPVVDVYTAFGGDMHMADNICTYTWMCSHFHDIHPTNDGYIAIAKAVESTLGLPGANPLMGQRNPASPAATGIADIALISQAATFRQRLLWN